MAGAAQDREFPVFQELLEHAAQAELHRLAVHQGQHDRAEIALQSRAALQVGEHGFGVGIAAEFHHHPHAVAVALIANVGNPADLAVVHLFGQFLDPAGLAQLVGQFRNHHGAAFVATFAGLHFLNVGHATHRDAAAAAQVGLADPAAQEHFAPGGEVGSGHQFQQFFVAEIGFADQGNQGIHHFAQVVGRDAGGHAHGNAGAAIQDQEWQLGGQHRGLLLGAIEVRGEIDRVAADFIQHPLVGDGGEPRFRVTHGCRWIVVDRAEVAVAIEQGMAAGKGLHQTHQGVVNGLIAVGVVLAQDVAHHPGALAVGAVGGQPQFVHRKQDAPLHRFEAIAHIR